MTTTERGLSWSERLNPRNWSLTVKLVIVALVPSVAALGLGALRISDQAEVAADLGRANTILTIRDQVDTTADVLRAERDAAVRFVAGERAGDRAAVQNVFAASDVEVAEYRQAITGSTIRDAATATLSNQTSSALDSLPTLRNDALGGTIGSDEILDRYSAIIAQADVLDRALLREVSRPDVAGLADAQTAVTSASEQLALQHTVLAAAIAAGELRPSDRTKIAAADAAFNAAHGSYQLALTADQQRSFGAFVTDPGTDTRARLEAAILALPDGRAIPVDPAAWDAAYATATDVLNKAGTAANAQLKADNTAAQESASNQAGIQAVILMIGLLLGIVIIVLLARSLIKSLRVLRTSALDIAERQLPNAVESLRSGGSPNATVEPVPIDSRDDIGQVARAFDAVHGQAVRLAVDQAALQANVNSMFVNLSRRSQALVERQLLLIEQLESSEQDADQLSNLFQLDHLATRMRRNSENLLVLAGTELSKRNIAPVPVVDVLRAAVSEVEQYQRIVVQTPPPVTIVGRAANDLVHLLAELLDNATTFSPPDSQVVLRSTRTPDGSILVEIADRGVGMAEHELSDANQRLSGPTQVDVSASRRMGLFVVGRLAARHGISIRLGTSTGGGRGGLTASVTVPGHLVPQSGSDGPPTAVDALPPAIASEPALPQLVSPNGHSRPGSLVDLVAGNDGPMIPAGPFDANDEVDGKKATTSAPRVNGWGQLPTRRPGANLRPTERVAPEGSATGVAGEAPGGSIAGSGPADPSGVFTKPAPKNTGSAPYDAIPALGGSMPRTTAGRAQGPRVDGIAPVRATTDRSGPGPAVGDEARRAEDGKAGTDEVGQDRNAAAKAAPDKAGWARVGQERTVLGKARAGWPARPGVSRPEAKKDAEPTKPGAAGPDAEQGRSEKAADESAPRRAFGPAAATAVAAAVAAAAARRGPDTADDTADDDAHGTGRTDVPAAAASRDGAPKPVGAQSRADEPVAGEPPAAAQAAQARGASPAAPGGAGVFAPGRLPTFPPAPPATRSHAVRPLGAQGRATPPPAAPAPEQPAATQRGAEAQADQAQPAPPARALSQSPQPQAARTQDQAKPTQDQVKPTHAQQPATPPPAAPPAATRPTAPAPLPTRPVRGPALPPATPVAAPKPAQEQSDSEFSTPIFAEIASAWFRSNRPVPITWSDDVPAEGSANVPSDDPLGDPLLGPSAPAARDQRPAAANAVPPNGSPANGASANGAPGNGHPPNGPAGVRPGNPRPGAGLPGRLAGHSAAMPPPASPAPADEFASVADEGWQAAGSTAGSGGDEFTAAGLPKRRPRARLVPGSAAGSAVLAAENPVGGGRTAEAVRGRLASYQQGIRQGRENRLRRDPTAGPRSTDSSEARPAGAGEQDEETR